MSPKYRFITFRFDRLNTLILQNDWSERSNFFELRGKIRAEAEFLKKIVTANKSDGTAIDFTVDVRLDTPVEVDYYRNGGILHTVLRNLAQ